MMRYLHYEDAGPGLKRLRERAKLTQIQVRDALGLTGEAVVSRWERGEAFPPGPRLFEFLELVDADLHLWQDAIERRDLPPITVTKATADTDQDAKENGTQLHEKDWDVQEGNRPLTDVEKTAATKLVLLAVEEDEPGFDDLR